MEQGTHEYLVSNQGFYSRLVNAQDLHQKEQKLEDNEIHELSSEVEDHPISLLRTKTTETRYGMADVPSSEKARDGLNYSLVKCLRILIVEHKALWPHFFITLVICIIGGKLSTFTMLAWLLLIVRYRVNISSSSNIVCTDNDHISTSC